MNNLKDEFLLLENFISSKPYLSFSGLSKLIYSPRLFYKHYVLNEREDSVSASLVKGKMLHALLLEEETVFDKFVILPTTKPDERNLQILYHVLNLRKELIDNEDESEDIHGLSYYQPEILSLMTKLDYHVKMKDDDERFAKFYTDKNIQYWEYLKESGHKTSISIKEYEEVLENKKELLKDKVVKYLLSNIIAEKEYKISLSMFGLRAFIDALKIDAVKQVIYISDIKTTGKTIPEFPESLEYYNYWLQAGVYYKIIKELYPEYKVIFTFIVIDTYGSVYPFKVSEETMTLWLSRVDELLHKVEYHFKTKTFYLAEPYMEYKYIL